MNSPGNSKTKFFVICFSLRLNFHKFSIVGYHLQQKSFYYNILVMRGHKRIDFGGPASPIIFEHQEPMRKSVLILIIIGNVFRIGI